jgi:hypothetical protein
VQVCELLDWARERDADVKLATAYVNFPDSMLTRVGALARNKPVDVVVASKQVPWPLGAPRLVC